MRSLAHKAGKAALSIPGLGERAASFTPVRILGRGSFGTAYLVEAGAATLVLKRVDMTHMKSSEREEALSECKVLNLLKDSRHIIQLHEHFENGGRLFLLMDFADGGDLALAIDKQKKLGTAFSETTILQWMAMLGLALRHAHSRRVLHRDLKPQNVFLTSRGEVRLGDFGISRVLNETLGVANTCVGTPLYLAPELINGESYGGSCDMWSLGCVLHELCALEPPFTARTAPALYLKVSSFHLHLSPSPFISLYLTMSSLHLPPSPICSHLRLNSPSPIDLVPSSADLSPSPYISTSRLSTRRRLRCPAATQRRSGSSRVRCCSSRPRHDPTRPRCCGCRCCASWQRRTRPSHRSRRCGRKRRARAVVVWTAALGVTRRLS